MDFDEAKLYLDPSKTLSEQWKMLFVQTCNLIAALMTNKYYKSPCMYFMELKKWREFYLALLQCRPADCRHIPTLGSPDLW
jgi:hypothetical protein